MKVNLFDTTVSQISKKLVEVREQGGAVALGRVLTLVIVSNEEGSETAIEAANEASREHPSRIITLIMFPDSSGAKLDAEIRVGGDAGASEVIILRAHGGVVTFPQSLVMGLLLPDAPVVAWWPNETPRIISQSPIGKIATRRITDSLNQLNSGNFLEQLSEDYAPGDSDFAWTRLTLWRAQFAALLDQPPNEPVSLIDIIGDSYNPSVLLLVAWLKQQLGCPVNLEHRDDSEGVKAIYRVQFHRVGSVVEIVRDQSNLAVLNQSGQPPKELSLPVRSLRDCLAEDLRRLDADIAYGKVILGYGAGRVRR